MRIFRERAPFTDPPVTLSLGELEHGLARARRAAREARRSVTRTARSQYRRYRASAGAQYLDWPRWQAEYLREYRSPGMSGPQNAWGGMPPGGAM